MKKISTRSSSPRHGTEQRARVLYVEDDDENWQVAQLRLEPDFEIVRAKDALEACSLLKTRGSDFIVILMDIELRGSDLNGIELTELFRGKRLNKDLPDYARNLPTFTAPIIFVTAHNARYTDVELMLFGADRVIPKPVNFESLTFALQSIQYTRKR
ncbi:MAG: response regulator [Polyangiales bacterium]